MFKRIFFDNSATTPVDPEVLEAIIPYLNGKFGNPSSIHFFGQEARAALDKARHQVASLINSRPNEVVFTSGGTESNNLAILGLLEANAGHGRHIIASEIEHPAVKNVCEHLETKGFEVTWLPVYENGIIKTADLEAAIREDTILVSVMAANNEIGTLQPIGEIGRIIRSLRAEGRKIWFHSDAVQAAGKIPLDVEEIGCDLLSISAHKLYAPKGAGALYARRGVRLSSRNLGGHQERERRGGTENVPGIIGLGKACEMAANEMEARNSHLLSLRRKLEDGIGENIEHLEFNGDRENRLPHLSNVSFRFIEGEALLINMDMQGIALSTGSACSSGTLEPSPVIRALGRNDEMARGAIRFSFGKDNTEEEVEKLLEILPKTIANLRRLAPQFQNSGGE